MYKKIFLVLIILFLFLIGFSQKQKNLFIDSLSISNVSSDMVNLVRNSLNFDYQKELKRKGFTFSISQRKLFINSFQKAYEKARIDISSTDFLANLPKEVDRYAIKELADQSFSIIPTAIMRYMPNEIRIDEVKLVEKYYGDFIRETKDLNAKAKEFVELKFKAYRTLYEKEFNALLKLPEEKFTKELVA